MCINVTPEKTTLDTICGVGSDPELDQLISSLAHINRQKPKPLVDTMMWWRRAKGEEVINAKKMLTDVSYLRLLCCSSADPLLDSVEQPSSKGSSKTAHRLLQCTISRSRSIRLYHREPEFCDITITGGDSPPSRTAVSSVNILALQSFNRGVQPV